jgi:transposase
MRKGINGLSVLAQRLLSEAFASGGMFIFRGKQADKVKLLWWDGQVASRSTQKKHLDVYMF